MRRWAEKFDTAIIRVGRSIYYLSLLFSSFLSHFLFASFATIHCNFFGITYSSPQRYCKNLDQIFRVKMEVVELFLVTIKVIYKKMLLVMWWKEFLHLNWQEWGNHLLQMIFLFGAHCCNIRKLNCMILLMNGVFLILRILLLFGAQEAKLGIS